MSVATYTVTSLVVELHDFLKRSVTLAKELGTRGNDEIMVELQRNITANTGLIAIGHMAYEVSHHMDVLAERFTNIPDENLYRQSVNTPPITPLSRRLGDEKPARLSSGFFLQRMLVVSKKTYRDVIHVVERAPSMPGSELTDRCNEIRLALMREQGFKTGEQLLLAHAQRAIPLGIESEPLFYQLKAWLESKKRRR